MELTNKLSAIGDAIRKKTGKSELLTLDAMPGEIASIETGGGGSIEVEPIVLTGACNYACAGAIASKYIELFGSTVSTKDIFNAYNMFMSYSLEKIPFDINIKSTQTNVNIGEIFSNATKLKVLPKINNYTFYDTMGMFQSCQNLREIPQDYFDNWDFSIAENATQSYIHYHSRMFNGCYSLRKLPLDWVKHMNPAINTTSALYYSGFNGCYALDELINIPIPYTADWISDGFGYMVNSCYRLRNLTFETNKDGSPLVKNWKSQRIDLATSIGYSGSGYQNTLILKYNSGITADKEVVDDATYQALKNDPDWFTCDINYSRYNHDSAVRTINTLPDTSAYLATAGGTNTIKFKGTAGALTDGGAINTLTEEEIAVATAKGWTVSLV